MQFSASANEAQNIEKHAKDCVKTGNIVKN